MNGWDAGEIEHLGHSDEIGIASRRADGSLRPFITIWVVRVGDDLYVRSAYGHENPWFQRAQTSGVGRIRAGDDEHDVTFEAPGREVGDAVTAAYHAKYDRYGANIVGTVVSAEAVRSTLRLVPA